MWVPEPWFHIPTGAYGRSGQSHLRCEEMDAPGNTALWQRMFMCVMTTKREDDDAMDWSKGSVKYTLTDTARCTFPFTFVMQRRRYIYSRTCEQFRTPWRAASGRKT